MRLIKSKNKTPFTSFTDIELVILYQQKNNTQSIGELYKRYRHIVFGVGLKYLKDPEAAEDALLEIFNSLFDLLKKYQIEDFKSWLLTVTRNYCLKELKNNQKQVSFDIQHEQNYSENFMENEQKIDHLLKKEKQFTALETALTKLKPEQQLCVRAFYLDNKSYQDIASETGFELKRVKSYIQNGKRNLQIIMTQKQ